MNAITGESGRFATLAPFSSPTLVTQPSEGARSTVFSRFHFAPLTCFLQLIYVRLPLLDVERAS
jgi:hypothetical protein